MNASFLNRSPWVRRASGIVRGRGRTAPPHEDAMPRAELFSIEQLRAHARTLADRHRVTWRGGRDQLLARLDENEEVLHEAYRKVATAVARGWRISPASEWLIDNFYLIQEQIHTTRLHLPRRYSRELPRLAAGPGEGLPRVYHLAMELIAHLDGRLDAEGLASFITAYQETATLRLGELWAIPIMLRLALFENMRRVADRISMGRDEFDQADMWADRLIYAADNEPANLIVVLADMAKSNPRLTHGFVAAISRRLRGKNPGLAVPLTWIEQRLAEQSQTLDECIQLETQHQAANQVSIGNSIGSMRVLAAIDWRDFVESMSATEEILTGDPAHVYSDMDFATRDRYRHSVERVARYARCPEEDVARRAIELAASSKARQGGGREHHVGYFLVDKGLGELERLMKVRLPWAARLRERIEQMPLPVYLSLILLISAAATWGVFGYAWERPQVGVGASHGWLIAVALVVVGLCASQLAVGAVNWLITWVMPPRMLPRMNFSKGIPADSRTMVVVPTMLSSDQAVRDLLDDLEVRFLANHDPHLHFALLTDFPDALQETMPSDGQRLETVRQGIEGLNEKYRAERTDAFFLFHRARRWNPREGRWMGYERKRGKLAEFNAVLRGAPEDRFALVIGERGIFRLIRYVITLDTDTELPRDSARLLAATMAHPLVRPHYDARSGRVCQGYAILQPRVAVSLPSARRSWFVKLFAGEPGLDPYTRVVSDVYQDMFAEGSYIGKGIYDVEVFHKAVEGRFPENRILSHDLIEGCHARAGLVSDVQLFEDHPAHYTADVRRRHRWIRGDWQIATWLLPRVPGSDARRIDNPLSGLSRWKILDNLRRSLVPVGLLFWFLLAWSDILSPLAGTVSVLGILLVPMVMSLIVEVTQKPADVSWLQSVRQALPSMVRQLAQVGFTLIFLPYDAVVSMDAILRTLYRVTLSRRSLLEWETASDSQRQASSTFAGFFGTMMAAPLLALGILAELALLRPQSVPPAAPFLTLWILSPFVAWWISRPLVDRAPQLTGSQQVLLRKLARKTWRFYETFTVAEDHYLPPDNFQEYPAPVTAHRTSPTNIGCALLANLAAYDFGYIPIQTLTDRVVQTMASLEKMERYHGHFYNWYDTLTLKPLIPLYVSSVDSGNLAGMLLTLRQGLLELRDAPPVPPRAFAGLVDVLLLFKEAFGEKAGGKPWHTLSFASRVDDLLKELVYAPQTVSACDLLLQKVSHEAVLVGQELAGDASAEARWAVAALERQCRDLRTDLVQTVPWIALRHTGESLPRGEKTASPAALTKIRQTLRDLESQATLSGIANLRRSLLPELDSLLASDNGNGAALLPLRDAIAAAAEHAARRLAALDELAEQCMSLAQMDFVFLFDKSRDQLATGYNVTERRRDPSYYDLLASEARLGSFIAIALEQLPQEHWFALGRRLTSTGGGPALLSWSGSMFEYLMPLLLMPTYDDTLLDQTYRAVVARQIQYGRQRHVPWGISESGYNTTDAQLNYQYRAFGVPGLGYKRGLADDLVIAPYATVMALMVAPEESARNLERMAHLGFVGGFGVYEAVDYTPSRLPDGQPRAIVRSFMAHHQGMNILALAYTMLDRPMQRRFLADHQLRANSLLLHERVPRTAPAYPLSAEMQESQRSDGVQQVAIRTFNSPQTPAPEAHLLSNGRYHVMITNAGGGTTQWNNLALTRWRVDPTRDCWGTFCYLRDLDTGEFWSATFQPTLKKPDRYAATFPQGRAEFRRSDAEIDTRLDVAVSPEADVEFRRLALTNRSRRRRRIELTSYAEVVLAEPAADAAHPAFSNLFVQTEILAAQNAILCSRRPRSETERPPVLLHLMTVQGKTDGKTTFETDRAKFLGRGRTLVAPSALLSNAPLSGSQGAVLDPIVAIRQVIVLDEDETASIDYVTGIAETRAAAVALMETHRDRRLGDRAFEMAWTHSQVVLRHLNASEADAQLFGRLLGSILYPNRLRRAEGAILTRNRRGQSALWGYGISGDLPLVLVRISDPSKMDLLRQMVQAHAYWRMKGLAVDLVIWNEDPSGYRQALYDQIVGLIAAGPEAHALDRPAGIFIRRLEQITEEDRILFQTVACAIVSDAAGTLADQVARRARPLPVVPFLKTTPRRIAELPAPKPAPRALEFFNGLGGMTADGKEYVITADPARPTPAPWSNVIANKRIGTVISESGSAYTFVDNAHEFRLTPWANDPVSDGSGEAFYLRDQETGEVWSPAPWPAPAAHAYTTRHGFGYTIFECLHDGIFSELCIYVALDAPVKFAVLKIDNRSARSRNLAVTGYWEWVLADLRAKSLMHVTTEIDARTGAILARNPFNPDFAERVAFVDVAESYRTLTADREEFLGRNGTPARPAALERVKLSGRVGGGLDPCAAIQVPFDVAPGQQREIVFVCGAGENLEEARDLIQRFRSAPAARHQLEATWDYWNRTLGAVHVETPDPSINLLANGWLLYQTLACRMWARSGFYQSGGAFGFRDQLQDAMALLHTQPQLLREHLLRAAGHQFSAGDVQHWWHPPAGRGVRTHFSDDFLWLPLAAARYVSATGDTGVLNERVPFLEGRPLKPEEESYYDLPQVSGQAGTLYEHCVKAIQNGLQFGSHGLPLIGCGDWNDGMNLIGKEGKGESVWLAFFLHHVLREFAAIAGRQGDEAFRQKCTLEAARLRAHIETHAWDGSWYRRAYFDDGQPLGSSANAECQIDALPQSWAVISAAADPQRSASAMAAVEERLVHRKTGIIQLFDPPFDKSALNPGYIKGYLPGVRENGGQYTHAAIWVVMAFALMGQQERAWELLALINPLNHCRTPEQVAIYKVEPYVVAADIYAVVPHTGRGGWTWYTGSAGWMYRLIIETLLGIRLEVDQLHLSPRVPAAWSEYKIHYRFRDTTYHIWIRRAPDGPRTILDGTEHAGTSIALANDRSEHHVEVHF